MENNGKHLIDGVIKFEIFCVICDFTVEMFQVFRMWCMRLLYSDVFMAIEHSNRILDKEEKDKAGRITILKINNLGRTERMLAPNNL